MRDFEGVAVVAAGANGNLEDSTVACRDELRLAVAAVGPVVAVTDGNLEDSTVACLDGLRRGEEVR